MLNITKKNVNITYHILYHFKLNLQIIKQSHNLSCLQYYLKFYQNMYTYHFIFFI